MICKRVPLLVSILLSVAFLDVRTSQACSCGPKPTVLAGYERSANVVIVQVISVEKSHESKTGGEGIQYTRVIVERVFKGSLRAGEEMLFAQGGGGDCIWTFSQADAGNRFLFYFTGRDGRQDYWYAGICGRSRKLEYAGDDLQYLENIAKVRGKTRLSGTLTFSQPSAIEGQAPIRRNLDGSKVRIVGEKETYELNANQNGVYEIYDLPAGKYLIYPEVPSGWGIDYANSSGGRRIDTEDEERAKQPSFELSVEAGKHAYYDFNYGVSNAISGKVLDPAGNGMKDVCLALLPAQGKPAFRKLDCTDIDGSFEFAGISPGNYIIAVNDDGKISSNEPFPTFYYPGALERDKAAVISIALGQIIEQINIFAPALEETVTVEGVCLYSDGKPAAEVSVQFESVRTSDRLDGKARATTDSSGRFAIKILKRLSGTLFGEMVAYSGQYENCPELEQLLKKDRAISLLRTNTIDVLSEGTATKIELRYPFRGCKKAK